MDAVADEMITPCMIAGDNIIEQKGQKQKRPVIVRVEADAGQRIVSKNKFYITECERMDCGIIGNPIQIIPQKRIFEIIEIESRPQNNDCDNADPKFRSR